MSEQTRPAASVVAVTPSNSTELAFGVRSLYVGTGGNVVVVFPDNTTATFTNVPSGTVLPVQAKRVNATSTTATDILALY